MDRAQYEDRWRRVHRLGATAGGPLVPAWLAVVQALARPLARRGVPPTGLTVAGLVLACLAAVVALVHARWALLAGALVLASGLADALDGAVALLRDRPSRWGAVLDAGADRLSELAFAGVLWGLGADARWPAAAMAASWWLEYLRERASSTVSGAPVVVTVGEKPTRVVVVAMFALAADAVPHAAAAWATAGAAVWLLASVVGLVQLGLAWGRLDA
ncbi:MAG: CDP-alcohol phosphatidyltransferase family protein [Actinomycetes bacterium]